MAGLFDSIGNGLKGLFGEDYDLASRAAAAAAIGAGDYGAVARIRQQQAQAKTDAAEQKQKQALMLHAYTAAKTMGMSDDEATVIASDPGKAADFISAWRKPHDSGPEGGFREDPITGKISSMPRYDGDGNYYAPNSDATRAPERLIKGTKAIPIAPGGSVVIADSVTGRPDGGDRPMSEGTGDLRSEAIKAIQQGADPAKVLERLKSLMGGQTGSAPSGGFPY